MPGLVDLSEATVHYEEQAEQPEEPSGEVTEEAAPKEETLEEVDQTEQINLKALNVEEEGADNSRTLEDGQQEEEAEVEVEEDEEGEIEERSDHEEVEEVAEQEEEEEEDEHFDENEEQAVNDDHKKTGGKVHRRPKKKNSTNSTSEGKEKGRRAKQKKVERDTSNSKASKVEVNKGSQEAETRVGRSHIIVAALALAVLAGLGLKVLRRKTVVSSSFFVEPLPEHCTREIPEHVKIFSADKKLPMKVMETKPSIALHAPCFLKSFQKVSRKYRPTGNWYWQKTDADSGERLSIQHQHEPAISSTRIRDDSAVVTFLTDHIFPKFGELNELSYDWYVLQQDAGFVVLLPDPAAHQSVFEAQSHWRPLFQKLAHTFYPKYFMAYASTFDAKSRKWIEKDFGITSFPAVVIFTGHPADQPQIVEQNALEMTYENLAQFIQDVEDGCLTWVHPLLTFNDLKPFTEKEMPTCPLKS
ncbi:unnamed protein product [Symbiodinium pilosum]|uniref:Thioredoxin domain-containing protein n=1 Tax=Symbiodinium pilosum TaxID=2952 RepID=A0A812P2P2_SYMPI|nr:unnamed protein product [Symbiodinium pilosum]